MNESPSKLPYGVRYHTGAEARLRRDAEDHVMRVFDGWCYEEIVTPALDYHDLFERGMGRAAAQRAFRFTDTDGRLLAMRPDVTSGVARAAATLFARRARPLRFAYAANVWQQQSRSHAEWRRESRQLGCELIGVAGAAGDVEMLLIVAEAFAALGLRNEFRVTLNHVGIFNGIAERLHLNAARREEMRRLIDARDRAALARLLDLLTDSPEDTRAFAKLVQLSGKDEMFARAREVISNKRSLGALAELETVWRTLDALGVSGAFEIDLGDAANLDYYTGTIFKIYAQGAGTHVGGGGRYDELIANFGASEPAIGFVLDLESITEVVRRRTANEDVDEASKANCVRTDAIISGTSSDLAAAFAGVIERRARGERARADGDAR